MEALLWVFHVQFVTRFMRIAATVFGVIPLVFRLPHASKMFPYIYIKIIILDEFESHYFRVVFFFLDQRMKPLLLVLVLSLIG